jgi:hypothetical protein
MNLELSDEQAEAPERELRHIIDDDRYPLSPRIQTLREIRNKIRPEPIREKYPEPKHHEQRRTTGEIIVHNPPWAGSAMPVDYRGVRGTFFASFFFAAMKAIGRQTVNLEDV